MQSSTTPCISIVNINASQAALRLRWRTWWWAKLTGVTVSTCPFRKVGTPGPKHTATMNCVFTASKSKTGKKQHKG